VREKPRGGSCARSIEEVKARIEEHTAIFKVQFGRNVGNIKDGHGSEQEID
jgi:hypothetical protein